MSDVLKKPVHAVLYKATALEQIAAEGRVPSSERPPLPKPAKKAAPEKFNPLAGFKGNNLPKQQMQKVRLQVIHDSVPPLPPDKIPPCDTCKTVACCTAFLVEITDLEYESGYYGEHAIKIEAEAAKQLKSRGLLLTRYTDPVGNEDTPQYYLEGRTGTPCPFLQDDNRCGIYEHRPLTCRSYTCIDDPRITEAVRQGEETNE